MSQEPDFDELALQYVESNQLTDQQMQAFYDAVQQQPAKRAPVSGQVCRLLYEFMEDVGTRITETLHIRKCDLDFDTRIVTVMHPKTESRCKCSTWLKVDRHYQLTNVDKNCPKCNGKGKWKKPQKTTMTPRIVPDLMLYCEQLLDEDLLFPGSRQSYYNWAKKAGVIAKINIFQQKDELLIKGMFLHLFRALCSKRITIDGTGDPFVNQMVDVKLRHSKSLRGRYQGVDINYLLAWEQKTYVTMAQKIDALR